MSLLRSASVNPFQLRKILLSSSLVGVQVEGRRTSTFASNTGRESSAFPSVLVVNAVSMGKSAISSLDVHRPVESSGKAISTHASDASRLFEQAGEVSISTVSASTDRSNNL